MASKEFELLAPFGTDESEKWFRNAYKWTRDEIFGWMEKVTKGQAGGPQAANEATVKLLAAIYEDIRKLSLPNGLIYRATGIQPNSHIVRLLNKGWEADDPTKSKFHTGGWPIAQSIPKGPGKVPAWWSPYDLLGLFLSLLGPAPEGANKNNYFLPLAAVYARWCSRIAGRQPKAWPWKPDDPGAGDWPFMFQVTWHLLEDSNKQRSNWFFLGASTAGDEFDPTQVGVWREEVQKERFDMLFACQRTTMVESRDFIDKKAPAQVNPSGTKVPFGNCAETYPFVARVLSDKVLNESLKGLALGRNFMSKADQVDYNEYSSGELWKSLYGPCSNCKFLIQQAGAKDANFHKNSEKDGAPIKK